MAVVSVGQCGMECGIVTAAASQHWGVATIGGGGAITADTTIFNSAGLGIRSLKISQPSPDAITTLQIANAIGSSVAMLRFYIYASTLPVVQEQVFACTTATGTTSTSGILLWDGTNNQMVGTMNGATTSPTAYNAVANTWYCIDMRYDVSGTTYKMDWWVNGVAQGQALKTGQTAGTVGKPTFGMNTLGQAVLYYDDMKWGTCAAGDPPFGAGSIKGFVPGSSGTHVSGSNGTTPGDLQNDAGTNLANGDTSWNKVDEVPMTSNSDFVKQVVARSGSYAEFLYACSSAKGTPNSVEQVVVFHNITTAANNQKAQLYDGTTATDAYALTSSGSVAGTLGNRSKHWATAPSGAWSLALLQATRIRWGFSTDVLDVPAFDSTMLEADFMPAVTGTGAVSFAHAALAGTGTQSAGGNTGTGAAAFAHPAIASSGTQKMTASGAAAFAHPALAGVSKEKEVATGAISLQRPSLAATSKETFKATGAATFDGPALAALGAASAGSAIGSPGRPTAGWEWHFGGNYNQVANKLTTVGHVNILELGAWIRGVTGQGATDYRLMLWSLSGTILGQTTIHVATEAAVDTTSPFGANLINVEQPLISPVDLPDGTDFYCGICWDESGSIQFSTRGSGTHYDNQHNSYGIFGTPDSHAVGTVGAYVADYIIIPPPTGTGALAFARPALAGVASEVMRATAAERFVHPALAGTGSSVYIPPVPGTGGVGFAKPTLAGVAKEVITTASGGFQT